MKSISYNLPIVRQIEGAHLVDALPYCDEFSEEERRIAEELIQEEMKNVEKKDYLASLNIPKKMFESCPLFKASLEGVKEKGVDLERYKELNSENISDWEHAQNRITLLFAHSEIRKMNLDLLLEYGTSAWTLHNTNLSAYKERLSSLISKLTSENDSINSSRKSFQENLRETLSFLSSEYLSLCSSNRSLEATKRKLQQEIIDLKRIKLHSII